MPSGNIRSSWNKLRSIKVIYVIYSISSMMEIYHFWTLKWKSQFTYIPQPYGGLFFPKPTLKHATRCVSPYFHWYGLIWSIFYLAVHVMISVSICDAWGWQGLCNFCYYCLVDLIIPIKCFEIISSHLYLPFCIEFFFFGFLSQPFLFFLYCGVM